MTVADLIAALQKLPQDMPVRAEGCDCVNPVTGAEVYTPSTRFKPEEPYALVTVDAR